MKLDSAWSFVKENDSFSYREFNFDTFVDYNSSLMKKVDLGNFEEIDGFYQIVFNKFNDNSSRIESRIHTLPNKFLQDVLLNDDFVSQKESKEYSFKKIKLESSATTDNLILEMNKLGYVSADLYQILETNEIFPHLKKSVSGLWSLFPAFNFNNSIWLPYLANVSLHNPDNSSLGVAGRTKEELKERKWISQRNPEQFVFVKKNFK